MEQEQINENKSFVAYYFAKFNDDAKNALGYRTFTEAFKDTSIKLGGPDNAYLKQRRDEFDVFYPWRKGYDNRPISDSVSNYHQRWKDISFEDFTQKVKNLLSARR